MTPAFTISSLNLPIAVRSSVLAITPASLSLLAFTITMKRMSFSVRFDVVAPHLSPALAFKDEPRFAAPTSRRKLSVKSLTNVASIVDRGVGGGPEVRHHGRCLRRIHQVLGQKDSSEALPRIGIPGGAISALPAVPARHVAELVASRKDRHPETPAAVVGKEQFG